MCFLNQQQIMNNFSESLVQNKTIFKRPCSVRKDGFFSARYFKPNEDGELRYNVVLRWEDEFDVAPLLPTMTVECWDRTTGDRATKSTFESETDHWPFVPVIFSNARLISGLNPDHEYYFIFRKDIPGALARITGTISH